MKRKGGRGGLHTAWGPQAGILIGHPPAQAYLPWSQQKSNPLQRQLGCSLCLCRPPALQCPAPPCRAAALPARAIPPRRPSPPGWRRCRTSSSVLRPTSLSRWLSRWVALHDAGAGAGALCSGLRKGRGIWSCFCAASTSPCMHHSQPHCSCLRAHGLEIESL